MDGPNEPEVEGELERTLAGWGNYQARSCFVSRPAGRAALKRLVVDGPRETYIARGLGRSYGDPAVNAGQGVLDVTALDRLLDFDAERGLLHCESGVSLAEIIRLFLPRGWFLSTTPGTKFVTIGGAIASDVHGKNHHRDGSFGAAVVDLEIMTAKGDVVHCSRAENAPLFWATIGGMGLTGVILAARIQLTRTSSAYCTVTYRRTENLDESLELFEATNADHRYSVAWVDCLARGSALGRSVLMLGNDAPTEALPRRARREPLALPRRPVLSMPIHAPRGLLNRYFVTAFNEVHYRAHRDATRIVDYDSYFYPLDGILHWNRLYGRSGFIQYQAFFPTSTSRDGLRELLEVVSQSGQASFLAVLKSSGPRNEGLLSYLDAGHTLALDLPNLGERTERLVAQMDEVLLRYEGRVYLAKDATTTPERLRSMYPRLPEMLEIKTTIDPACRFASSQARRLGLLSGSPGFGDTR